MMRLRLPIVLLAFAFCLIAACVIGPKHDDPSSGDPAVPETSDTGAGGGGSDTGTSLGDDASLSLDSEVPMPVTDGAAEGDVRADGDASETSEASSDAPTSDSADALVDGDAAD
jgi:hypothetical protein